MPWRADAASRPRHGAAILRRGTDALFRFVRESGADAVRHRRRRRGGAAGLSEVCARQKARRDLARPVERLRQRRLSAHSKPDGNRQRRRVRRRLGTGQPDDDSRLPHGLHLLRHLRAVRDAVRLVRAADVCCHHLARHIHRNGSAHPLPRAAGHGLHRHAWLADVHHHRRGD